MKLKSRSLLVIILSGFLILSCENSSHNESSVVTGILTCDSNCKANSAESFAVSAMPDSISSVEYVFDKAQKKLVLKHINAAFNCCPDSLYCQIVVQSDTIFIQECEKNAQCDCNCLYDLELELNGVDAQKYQVKLVEPYAYEQPILFEMDLTKQTQGTYQVIRTYYPWGMRVY